MEKEPRPQSEESGKEKEKLEKEPKLVSVEEIIPDIRKSLDADKVGEKFENRGLNNTKEFAREFVNQINSEAPEREAYEQIKKYFKGQIVLDLGAGWGDAYGLICSSGAKAYIGVDKFANDLAVLLSDQIKNKKFRYPIKSPEGNKEPITAAAVNEDILSFLKRLPDSSVSIFAAGIDNSIFSDPRYKRAVEDEIRRVLDPNGAFIQSMSELFGGSHYGETSHPNFNLANESSELEKTFPTPEDTKKKRKVPDFEVFIKREISKY